MFLFLFHFFFSDYLNPLPGHVFNQSRHQILGNRMQLMYINSSNNHKKIKGSIVSKSEDTKKTGWIWKPVHVYMLHQPLVRTHTHTHTHTHTEKQILNLRIGFHVSTLMLCTPTITKSKLQIYHLYNQPTWVIDSQLILFFVFCCMIKTKPYF